MAEDTFDIRKWLSTRSRVTDAVPVTQPKQVAVWTKTSKRDGGRFLHGDRSGAQVCRERSAGRQGLLYLKCSCYPCPSIAEPAGRARCCWHRAAFATSRHRRSETACGNAPCTAGLLTFQQPRLPADLNAGFPDKYISKDDGEASPVDTIVEAGNRAGVNWQVHYTTWGRRCVRGGC